MGEFTSIPSLSKKSYKIHIENRNGNNGKVHKIFEAMKESCCLASDQHFYFKCFPENDFVSKISPKLPGLF